MSYCVMLMPEAAGEGEEAGLIVFGMIIGVGSGSAPRSLTTTPLTSSRCAALSSSLTVGIAMGSVGLGGSMVGSTVRTASSRGICKDALAAQLQLEEYVQRAVNASGQRSMCRFLQLHLAEIALETRPALWCGHQLPRQRDVWPRVNKALRCQSELRNLRV